MAGTTMEHPTPEGVCRIGGTPKPYFEIFHAVFSHLPRIVQRLNLPLSRFVRNAEISKTIEY
jgi:hypothetical protein